MPNSRGTLLPCVSGADRRHLWLDEELIAIRRRTRASCPSRRVATSRWWRSCSDKEPSCREPRTPTARRRVGPCTSIHTSSDLATSDSPNHRRPAFSRFYPLVIERRTRAVAAASPSTRPRRTWASRSSTTRPPVSARPSCRCCDRSEMAGRPVRSIPRRRSFQTRTAYDGLRQRYRRK
jgi:hypothetical protein